MLKPKQTRYGIFYRSNGHWTGPYQGATFTKYAMTHEPVKSDIRWFANYVLKSRVKVVPIG